MPKVKSEKDGRGALDCGGRQRKFWLVKVPKYVSEEWQSRGPNAVVGKLKVGQEIVFESLGGPSASSASSSPAKAAAKAPFASSSAALGAVALGAVALGGRGKPAGGGGEAERPKEHRFVVHDLGPQDMAIYSEDLRGLPDPEQTSGKLALEGTVVKRAELRPPSNLNYMRMKAKAFEAAAKPTRSIVSLDRAANKYLPVNMHREDVAKDKAKRAGETKTVRLERDRMMEAVFAAFEKHQFYKLSDLAAVTNQPQSYVREILNEVASYVEAPPHKNMWELKEEYRHYKGMDQT